MGVLSADTSLEAEQVQMGILRAKGLSGRLELLGQAIETSWALVNSGCQESALDRWLGQPSPLKSKEKLLPLQPLSTPLQVARSLDSLAITYVIGGSYASSIHGEPRSTRDCDFLVGLKREHLEPPCPRAGGRFLSKPH